MTTLDILWVAFFTHRNECFDVFTRFSKKVQNEKGFQIFSIRSDHGRKFKNERFKKFYDSLGITHNFSSPKTPQ